MAPPGARHRNTDAGAPLVLQIAYVTVAGKFLKGAGLREKGATIGQKVVGAGYAQVRLSSANACWSLCWLTCLSYQKQQQQQ